MARNITNLFFKKYNACTVELDRVFVFWDFQPKYDFPKTLDFPKAMEEYGANGGFIAFNHYNHYEITKKLLRIFPKLGEQQFPLTGDTIWHMNPLLISDFESKASTANSLCVYFLLIHTLVFSFRFAHETTPNSGHVTI